ncbi:MAG: T9SS type A sorting domain-containing protein [Ignavibacteria bacterium]
MKFIIYLILSVSFIVLSGRDVNSAIVNITVSDFIFSPASVNVMVGDTVRWTWAGARAHTTTCDGLSPGTLLPPGASPWDATLDGGSPIFNYVVGVEGNYSYICLFHYLSNNMVGTITAEAPLPVELTDFVATTIKNEVILDWATGGEINNERFEIQRISISSISKDLNPEELPFQTIGILHGNGTSSSVHNYKYIDRNLRTGIYLYRLKQVDYNSNFIYHLLHSEVVIGVPNKFHLSQNYPNPFNPVTHVNFELPEDGFVNISMFDISGKMVSTILNSGITGGYQSVEINGSDFSSGVYYYRIDFRSASGIVSETKKMMLIK